ncbi:MAG TPA: hypothetical protein PLF01_06400, partial [Alphaproteobacteria bacterium]|nr:hypothetical protein [Alphaproteobacteria bacterium]
EYTKTVSIGGRAEQAYGTACYKPDGSWEIVNLEGSDTGRAQVRQVMYEDLQRSYNPRPYNKVVVVERYSRPYYPRYRHSHASYYSGFPFVLNFAFGDRDDHHDDHRDYKKAHYKKDYRKYDRHDNGRRAHR